MKNIFIALVSIILLNMSSVALAAGFSFGDVAEYGDILGLSPVMSVGLCSLCCAALLTDLPEAEIKKLLKEIDVNHKCEHRTPLIWAVNGKKIKLTQLLLGNKADVNAKSGDDGGMTALMFAAKDGHRELAQLLLDNKAAVNAKSRDGDMTALMFAVKDGHRELVELLLEYGANLDITNEYGKNALDFAKGKPIMRAILKKHINDVVRGRKSPSRDKTVSN
ncbi:MAG: ankyrin repeat domain-containing protein [Gammaproteobacteria bacterium WSBS_2016_MAG_OTU1]